MTDLLITPASFIAGPYIECPMCGKVGFGVLHIGGNSYNRRCRECFYPKSHEPMVYYQLPPVRKKIIYLDQFAISNMMHAINPDIPEHKRGPHNAFWLDTFKSLCRLVGMQLAICPMSAQHREESMSYMEDALDRMNTLLSRGISYLHNTDIKLAQFHKYVSNICKPGSYKDLIACKDALDNDVNHWCDTITVTVRTKTLPSDIENAGLLRGKYQNELNSLFKHWATNKRNSLRECIEHELSQFGPSILQCYHRAVATRFKAISGQIPLAVDAFMPGLPEKEFLTVQSILSNTGDSKDEQYNKTVQFISGCDFSELPFLLIGASLFGALAWQACNGRRKPPNYSILNDIEIVSAYLPYCDAMLIDNECRELYSSTPIAKTSSFAPAEKLYSINSKERFTKYLSDIEMSVTPEHISKLNEVYGNKWEEPFSTLYTYNKTEL